MNIFLVVGFMIRKACCSPQLGLVRIEDLLHVRLDGLELLLTAHTASVPCGLRPVPAPPISYPGRLIVYRRSNLQSVHCVNCKGAREGKSKKGHLEEG